MTTMIDEARMKLADESSKDNKITPLEELLTDMITNDNIAAKILAEGKTLKGAMDMIRQEAKKDAKGGVGYVSDKRAVEIAEEYYGIADTARTSEHVIDIVDLL